MRTCFELVVFDTSTKVLILARVQGFLPERSEGDNYHTSVTLSFARVSNNIFTGGVKVILIICKMQKVTLYAH